MKIIFGYYDDEDFGLTPYPDISSPDKKDFASFEEYKKEEEKIGEYRSAGRLSSGDKESGRRKAEGNRMGWPGIST